MYVLFWKEPKAIHDGKSGYVMSWRGKQLAMCEGEKPLAEWISRQRCPENYYIERFPC